MLSSTYNPFLLFYHHKEPSIVCPLEHETNAHFTFPCHTFLGSTNPCRGSRTLTDTAHLTKSCQVMPDIRPHDLSHQCLLTWYIHLRLVHCLLLIIPNPLPYCLNMTTGRHTKAATQWNRDLPPLKVPRPTSHCPPPPPPGVMHQQDSTFLRLLLPTPKPQHIHWSDLGPQESGHRQLHGKNGFFLSNEPPNN